LVAPPPDSPSPWCGLLDAAGAVACGPGASFKPVSTSPAISAGPKRVRARIPAAPAQQVQQRCQRCSGSGARWAAAAAASRRATARWRQASRCRTAAAPAAARAAGCRRYAARWPRRPRAPACWTRASKQQRGARPARGPCPAPVGGGGSVQHTGQELQMPQRLRAPSAPAERGRGRTRARLLRLRLRRRLVRPQAILQRRPSLWCAALCTLPAGPLPHAPQVSLGRARPAQGWDYCSSLNERSQAAAGASRQQGSLRGPAGIKVE
jgi:hypothetical protein